MGLLRDMAVLAKDRFYDNKIKLYLFDRAWNMEDLRQIMRYDLLEVCALTYVLSDGEKRRILVQGAGEVLDLAEPENAIRYMLYYHVNDQQKALDVLHRIPRCSGFFLKSESGDSQVPDKDSLTNMMLYLKELMLVGIHTENDQFSLGGPLVTLRALLDCQEHNLLSAGLSGTNRAPVEWPSYDELMEIWRRDEWEQDPYEPTGDAELDEKALSVYGVLKGQVEGLFRYQIEQSEERFYYRPYRDHSYVRACSEMAYIDQLTAASHDYRKPVSLEPDDGMKKVMDEWYALAEEAERLVCLKEEKGIPLRDAFRVELLDFLLYLAASDGYIARKEVEMINRCCGLELTRSRMESQIREDNLYTVTFERRVPFSLNVLCQADSQLKERREGGSSYSDRYLSLIGEAGRLFLLCDGSANEDEKRDLKTYVQNLKSYADANSGKREEKETDAR